MKQDDQRLQERLRAADPARGVELSHLERTRIRTRVVEAARLRPAAWLRPVTLRWGAVGVVAAAALLLALWGRAPVDHRAAGTTPVLADSAVRTIPPPVAQDASPRPAATRPALAHRETPARTPPRHTAYDDIPTTRIVFTAPEGTRIFWFGAGLPAKEDAT